MDYRSDVKVLITVPTKKTNGKSTNINSVLEDIRSYTKLEKLDELFNEILTNKELKLIYLESADVKWYDSFDEVKGFDDYVNEFEDIYKDGGIHYIRIGEDYEDVDEIIFGNPQEYLEFYREARLETYNTHWESEVNK